MIIDVNFKTGMHSSELDDFDFELSVALDAIPRCKTPHEEELLQKHFESLLARCEQGMGGTR